MNLCLDIGNTRTKVAVFDRQNQLVQHTIFNGLPTVENMNRLIDDFQIRHTIVSSVGENADDLIDSICRKTVLVQLSASTPIPIDNKYVTPQTLGNDRLAAVIGANNLFPETNLLVIDAGTCIKYDFINAKGSYLGGAISPGIMMRFKALHTFTQKLPFIETPLDEINFLPLVGNNTYYSLISGVIVSALAEMDGIIDRYRQEYSVQKVILTGGDAIFFEKRLNNQIFVSPNLVPEGLNKILKYNVGNI